ncbi:MAG: hypothetical protein ACK5KT_04560 [Dysgonomonas sp.]
MKLLKHTMLSIIILSTMIGIASLCIESITASSIRDFYADGFKSIDYTDDELGLFCDIAFMHEDVQIRKWSENIKVEIKNISDIDQRSVAEVDSIIAILAPLIIPLKIERVEKNGNIHVYRHVNSIKSATPHSLSKPKYVNGLTQINKKTPYNWNITFACIYDGPSTTAQTLLHEFEHALGLGHPFKPYPYYLTIGRSVIPQYFRTNEEFMAFINQPFYMSEQEKKVIRMLYSPDIKSGLHIDIFAQKMEFDEEDRKAMLPNIKKKPKIIVYPSPDRYPHNR